MKKLPGEKTKKIYQELISKYLPKDIENYTYVEPFGGTFAINTFLPKRPKTSIYNDINFYKFDIDADIIHHVDFEEIISLYDTKETLFYLDPPYYNKEHLYDSKKDIHKRLKNSIQNITGKFVLSYEKCNYILKLYKDFNIFYYEGEHFSLRNEIIITKIK